MTERLCVDCGVDISSRGNKAIRCKSCAKAAHKNRDREKSRSYYAQHKKQVIEASRRWKVQNKCKHIETKRLYYAKNRTRLTESARRCYRVKRTMQRTCEVCAVDIFGRKGSSTRCATHALDRAKEVARLYRCKWYELHKEKRKEYYRSHKQAKPPLNKHCRRCLDKLPEVCSMAKTWCDACAKERDNKRRRDQWKRYSAANVDKLRDRYRNRKAKNPEKFREKKRRHRARKLNQLGSVSPRIEHVLLNRQGNNCAATHCRKRLGNRTTWHLDHIMPLALGGLHDSANLQILCARCNISKGAKHPDDWLKEHGSLPLERTGT